MITANYLGMPLELDDTLDNENREYFACCAKHEFRLQRCCNCHLFRYPPQTACPWCTDLKADWVPVEGKGTVHSYTCLLYTSPSPRDRTRSRMPSSA